MENTTQTTQTAQEGTTLDKLLSPNGNTNVTTVVPEPVATTTPQPTTTPPTEDKGTENKTPEPTTVPVVPDEIPLFDYLGTIFGLEKDVYKELPSTYEGIQKFVEHANNTALGRFEMALQEKFPDLYRALEIGLEGGNYRTLFKDDAAIEISKADVGTQEALVRNSLKAKGIDEDTISSVIAGYSAKGKLYEKAIEIQKQNDEQRLTQANQLLEDTKKQKEFIKKAASEMQNNFSAIIGKGELANFIIPQQERNAFAQYVNQSIKIADNGSFFVTTNIENANLTEVLQALYFTYKKGDLSSFIQKSAASLKVEALKQQVNGQPAKAPEKKTALETLFSKK